MVPLLPLSRLSWPPSCRAKISTNRPPTPELPASPNYKQVEGGVVGNVHYRISGKFIFLDMFWEGDEQCAPGPTDNIHKMPS